MVRLKSEHTDAATLDRQCRAGHALLYAHTFEHSLSYSLEQRNMIKGTKNRRAYILCFRALTSQSTEANNRL